MGRSNQVRRQFRLLFFKRTIILLIHHQFLQFWYQCIKKTSIYHIIGHFSKNCRHNTRKTDKVYDFLQSAKLSFVGDLWTQALCSISQSPRATSVRHHSLTSFGSWTWGLFWVQRSPTQVNFADGGNSKLCQFFRVFRWQFWGKLPIMW